MTNGKRTGFNLQAFFSALSPLSLDTLVNSTQTCAILRLWHVQRESRFHKRRNARVYSQSSSIAHVNLKTSLFPAYL